MNYYERKCFKISFHTLLKVQGTRYNVYGALYLTPWTVFLNRRSGPESGLFHNLGNGFFPFYGHDMNALDPFHFL